MRAAYGGAETGPSPVDRAKPGSKHHVIVEVNGIPLTSSVTEANLPDIKEFAPLFNTLPAVGGKGGHPKTKPDAMMGDRGYDSGAASPGSAQHGGRATVGGEEHGER